MSRKLMRLLEISKETGVPVATLRFYRHKGIGPKTFKLGRNVVAFADDVDTWIDEQAKAGATAG
jgi:predicted DNA-binding transcriptional regulator AlpA